MKGRMVGYVVAAMLAAVNMVYAGPKLAITNDAWISVSFLGQVHYAYDQDATSKNEDFFVRRARIILQGQVMDGVLFFAETDNDKAGKNGESAVSTDIQDLFADFRLLKRDEGELWVSTGLILLPFSFENKSSAASLLGVDYNAEAIKFVNDFTWRDIGAELHGNLGKIASFRVGAFDGYDQYATKTLAKNPDAALRYTGHVSVDLLGTAETGFFYTQERLAGGHYLALGAGFDTQNRATRTIAKEGETATVADARAWVADLQSGFELGAVALTLNGAYYDWENGVFNGNTYFAETGVKFGKAMVTGKYTTQDPDKGATVSDRAVGFGWFFKKHNARVGVEYRWGDSNDQLLAGVQVLL